MADVSGRRGRLKAAAEPGADQGAPVPASPREAHLEMVGAVLAGDGLERVAQIASARAGAPVAVVVPRLGTLVQGWQEHERYVGARLAGGRPARPANVTLEVPISSGGRELGAVLMLGKGRADAHEYLHMAAIAALTEVAVVEARDETEQSLRGAFIEEALRGRELDPVDVERRAARLGCDLSAGFTALCGDPNGRSPGRLVAALAADVPSVLALPLDGKVYALLPGDPDLARRVATRISRQATIGLSAHYARPEDVGRALEESELVLAVTAARGGEPVDAIGGGGAAPTGSCSA